MKRFIDTEIFRKKWFRKLPEGYQQLWIYLFCECDSAGVIDYDEDYANVAISYSISIADVLDTFGEDRITRLKNGKLWLISFCSYQYQNGVSPSAKVHSKVRESIQKNNLPIPIGKPLNTYSIPIKSLSNTSQDKDKDKDKDKVTNTDKVDPEKIAIQISTLVESWSPHLLYDEQVALSGALPKWESLSEADWSILRAWYADKTERSQYRTNSKSKLIEKVDEEIAKAKNQGFKAKATINPDGREPDWLPGNWRRIKLDQTDKDFSETEWCKLERCEKEWFERAVKIEGKTP